MLNAKGMLISAMVGFALMLAGFIGYVYDPKIVYSVIFIIGLAIMVASYLLLYANNKRIMASVDALNEEESANGYVYYMDGEPMGLETEILDLTKE